MPSTGHKAVVRRLQNEGLLSNESAIQAMLAIDRKDFIDIQPYIDSPQPIGYGATISAPHMHAIALENLAGHLRAGAHALDVGAGTGYLSACMAHMVGQNGNVVGIEHIDELAQIVRHNVGKNHKGFLDEGRLKIIFGDGRQGCKEFAPYNAIHVGAAAPNVPNALIEQLAPGGRLILPVGSSRGNQTMKQLSHSLQTAPLASL